MAGPTPWHEPGSQSPVNMSYWCILSPSLKPRDQRGWEMELYGLREGRYTIWRIITRWKGYSKDWDSCE